MAICAVVAMATAGFRLPADSAATAGSSDRSFTGTIVSVDTKERVLNVKSWTTLNRAFNLGDNCTFVLMDKNNPTVNDLRPGEKVRVKYQDAHGVLIADRVEQQPMRYDGMVVMIDPDKHQLKLRHGGFDTTLQLADDCKIVLRNDKIGSLADIHPGNHVTVTYEDPSGVHTAREIAQTSIEFTGTLTAIDLGERTLKARSVFDTKKFNVADNCAVVINGKPNGQLGDLKPNDKLILSYDEIDGVNVVNRIAPAESQPGAVANTPPPGSD
jgi:hypothetical protein